MTVRKKVHLLTTMICIGLMAISGCAREEAEDVMPELATAVIASGSIYELTDNSFQEGFEYDFSQDELAEITKMLKDKSLKLKKKTPKKEEIVYSIYFYQDTGEEVLSLAIDMDGKIYHEDGYYIKSEELTEYFRTLIENSIME